MKWDRACECSEVGAAVRKSAHDEEPDFVRLLPSGQARVFNRNLDNERIAQRLPFVSVYDHEDWLPLDATSAVDLLATLVEDGDGV